MRKTFGSRSSSSASASWSAWRYVISRMLLIKTAGRRLNSRAQACSGRRSRRCSCRALRYRTKAIEQALAHFIGAVVLRDFLPHEEDVRVALQLLSKRFLERLAICDLAHVAHQNGGASVEFTRTSLFGSSFTKV